ncbi:hypothetical protein KS4_04930 [Poriferisphaera corsica]|uniref:Uncharacterized protein n=1 Tax=Poriferisphaera corsica TaxID=2528020 RepID=A0A517YQH2_9BACT|nr:hypothetical protein KS4_04930 [Poriferisphaera corsica]
MLTHSNGSKSILTEENPGNEGGEINCVAGG